MLSIVSLLSQILVAITHFCFTKAGQKYCGVTPSTLSVVWLAQKIFRPVWFTFEKNIQEYQNNNFCCCLSPCACQGATKAGCSLRDREWGLSTVTWPAGGSWTRGPKWGRYDQSVTTG